MQRFVKLTLSTIALVACSRHPSRASPSANRKPSSASVTPRAVPPPNSPPKLSSTCVTGLVRAVSRARATFEAKWLARGFTAAALHSDETECSRRLRAPQGSVAFQRIVAMLDADECLPGVALRLEPAARGAPSGAWRKLAEAPAWLHSLAPGAMPIALPPLRTRSANGLTAYVLADPRDVSALEKAADACLDAPRAGQH